MGSYDAKENLSRHKRAACGVKFEYLEIFEKGIFIFILSNTLGCVGNNDINSRIEGNVLC